MSPALRTVLSCPQPRPALVCPAKRRPSLPLLPPPQGKGRWPRAARGEGPAAQRQLPAVKKQMSKNRGQQSKGSKAAGGNRDLASQTGAGSTGWGEETGQACTPGVAAAACGMAPGEVLPPFCLACLACPPLCMACSRPGSPTCCAGRVKRPRTGHGPARTNSQSSSHRRRGRACTHPTEWQQSLGSNQCSRAPVEGPEQQRCVVFASTSLGECWRG